MPQLIEQGIKVDLILTDLPYGTTQCKWDNLIPFEPMWECVNQLSYDTTPCILFGSEPFSSRLRLSNLDNYKYDWVWEKQQGTGFLNAKKMPLKIHENILMFYIC